jgi:hypothetical protein
MEAEGLCVNRDLAPVVSNHDRSLRDAKRLPRRFLGIADQRVLKFTRAQRSIRLVTPVRERLSGNGETRFPKDIQHRRPSESNQHNVAAPACDTFGYRFRQLAIAHRLIVKRAMRFDVS